MLRRTLAFASLLILNACSGRYEVGTQDGDDDPGGASSNSAGAGGTGGTNAGEPRGDTSGGTPAVTCDAAALPMAPISAAISPSDAWQRVTRFVAGEELEPEAPLPSEVTHAWVEATVADLYERYPDGPMFERVLRRAGFSETLAAIYGEVLHRPLQALSAPFATGLFPDVEPFRDAGVLTDREFLTEYPSISARGAFMANAFLCLDVGPPPADVTAPVEGSPGKTRRQALHEAVSSPSCLGCHQVIDPLGASLENFDVNGEWRDTDNGIPVDPSGSYDQLSPSVMFGSYRDLRSDIGGSCEYTRCFARRLLVEALSMSRNIDTEVAATLVNDDDVTRISAIALTEARSVVGLVQLVATSRTFLE